MLLLQIQQVCQAEVDALSLFVHPVDVVLVHDDEAQLFLTPPPDVLHNGVRARPSAAGAAAAAAVALDLQLLLDVVLELFEYELLRVQDRPDDVELVLDVLDLGEKPRLLVDVKQVVRELALDLGLGLGLAAAAARQSFAAPTLAAPVPAAVVEPACGLLRGLVELAEELGLLVGDVANARLEHVEELELLRVEPMPVEHARAPVRDDHGEVVDGLDPGARLGVSLLDDAVDYVEGVLFGLLPALGKAGDNGV